MADKYIERKALIDFCKKIIHDRWNETTAPVSWSHAYADFIDDINNQPAADVVHVKHGEWKGYTHSVFFRLDKDDNPICRDRVLYYCSECSRRSSIKTNYCQNCGAKMDGGDKNAR